MLAKRVPFTGDTASHTIVSILEKEPLALENVPAELQRIVRKALTKDADMRYQSARDLLIDLKNLRRDLDIQGEIERSIIPNREVPTSAISENETRFYDSAGTTRSGQVTPTQNVKSSSLEYAVTQAKSHKLALAIVGVGLLATAVTVAYFVFLRKANDTPGQIKSIAVMPFMNESGNTELEYLSDGMTDTLISSLSQLPNLSVKARSSVFRYKGKETNPQTIGKDLNVQAILNGRIAQRGDQLTLTLDLVDAQTENVIWSDRYIRKESTLIDLQSEIARDVSTKLRTKLSGTDEQKVAKTYTATPEAYQLYLKGLYHWNKRTPESLKSSLDHYSQAIAKEPAYAQAYAGLALTYVLLPEYSVSSPHETLPKAKSMARKALELDETLAEAHTALGYSLFSYDWNFAEADREFQRAIELNPNFATAHQWRGETLRASQRFDEAIAEGKRARELDPFSLIINHALGLTYLYARQYDQAIEQFRKTVELDQNWYNGHLFLGFGYEAKGLHREAIAEYQKAVALNEDPYALAFLGHVYGVSGRKDEALKILTQMSEIAKQRYVPAYSFGMVYAGLGDKTQAFQWLERSYQDRAYDVIYLNVDPQFDSLHSDPRFADLVRRVGL
jgi:TolB-like protein